MRRTSRTVVLLIACTLAGALEVQAQADSAAIQQFQRAADSYAFSHRRTERRRDAMPLAAEGTLFTPVAAAAFRARIALAVKSGCEAPAREPDRFTVPAVNTSIEGTQPLAACLAARLPKLPEELEYRVAGIALILADAHLRVVVDVLHAAFPAPGR